MNKRGLLGSILFIIIVVLSISVIAFGSYLINKNMQEFCEGNGFTSYEKAFSRWNNNLCIKIEDNYRVEKIFDSCGDKYCFVLVATVEGGKK